MPFVNRFAGAMRSVARALTTKNETGWSFALPVLCVFAVAQVLAHIHHEPWRDEVSCWTIGRTASGLGDLLTGDRRYDGHPFLWYYLLYLVSRLSPSHLALHFVSGGLAVLSAALWLRWAPVPRFLRVMLLGSYYFFYEYGVICRSYGLGWFLICALCALYHPKRIRYVWSGVLLGLLSATSLYGAVLSIALGWFVFSHGFQLVRMPDTERRLRLGVSRGWIVGVAIFTACLILTVVTTLPPSDAQYAPRHHPDITWPIARDAAGWFWKSLFPFHGLKPWEWGQINYLGSKWPRAETLAPWLGIGWMAAWIIALRRRPRIALTYAGGAILIALAQIEIYWGGWRHIGHNFILETTCVWLYARDTRGRRDPWLLYGLFAINLVIQIITGFSAVRTDWKLPFGGAEEAAAYIRGQHLESLPVVANSDAPGAAVAAVLRKPFFYPATGETSDYIIFHNRRGGPSENDVLAEAVRLARADKGKALLVLNYDNSAIPPAGVSVKLLHRGAPVLVGDESFRIYSVEVRP